MIIEVPKVLKELRNLRNLLYWLLLLLTYIPIRIIFWLKEALLIRFAPIAINGIKATGRSWASDIYTLTIVYASLPSFISFRTFFSIGSYTPSLERKDIRIEDQEQQPPLHRQGHPKEPTWATFDLHLSPKGSASVGITTPCFNFCF